MSLVSKKTFELCVGGYIKFEYIRRGNPSAVTGDYVKITEWSAFIAGVKIEHAVAARKSALLNSIATPYVKCKNGYMIVMFLDSTDEMDLAREKLLELGYIEQ